MTKGGDSYWVDLGKRVRFDISLNGLGKLAASSRGLWIVSSLLRPCFAPNVNEGNF